MLDATVLTSDYPVIDNQFGQQYGSAGIGCGLSSISFSSSSALAKDMVTPYLKWPLLA